MTDIVERLDRIGSDLEFGLHVSEVDIVAAVCEASAEIMARDAEIVRLRGEVGKLQILLDGLALSASIAPAEAKGEAPGKNVHTEHCCREHGCKYGDAECPVGHGRQVQSYPCDDCTPQPADGGAVAWIKPDWQKPENFDGMSPVTTYPQVGWLPLYTHPAGDALGAVRELVAKWRAYGPEIGPSVGYMARKACADELEAALQHRGDSRGGEG